VERRVTNIAEMRPAFRRSIGIGTFVAFGVVAPLLAFLALEEQVEDERRLWLDTVVGTVLRPSLPETPIDTDHLVALGTYFIVAALALAPFVLLWRRKPRQALFSALAVSGVVLLQALLEQSHRMSSLHAGPSFPSAGAMLSMTAVAAAVLLAPPTRRLLVAGVGGTLVFGQGAALVAVGWNYPSDVLGGWVLSLAFVSALWILVVVRPAAAGASGAARALAFVRAHVPREPIDAAFDWVRFQIDAPASVRYQPLPWADRTESPALRAAGTQSRWEAIAPIIRELNVRSAVDVGCNIGWFMINLARLGIPTLGFESHPPSYRTAIYSAGKSGLPNAGVVTMAVGEETVRLLPAVDCVLFLSVWHHIVREQGRATADSLVAKLWERTQKVLFFETGENEMPSDYGLPAMTPDARTWLTGYLETICEGGAVRHLGLHESGVPRNLFAVVRREPR
jgi:membrane-associated phospholipid phosphatase